MSKLYEHGYLQSVGVVLGFADETGGGFQSAWRSGGRALHVEFEAPAGFADVFRAAFLFASPNIFNGCTQKVGRFHDEGFDGRDLESCCSVPG